MKMNFSGLGAEPKKLAILGLCVVGALIAWWVNSSPSESSAASATVSATRSGTTAADSAPVTAQRPAVRRGRGRGNDASFLEFHPSLKPDKNAPIDRASIDPTLRLDLLRKLRGLPMEGGSRSLFEAGSAAAAIEANVPKVPKIEVAKAFVPYGPRQPAPPAPKVEPPAPPIPLKFYGFVNPRSAGVKRAFFLDGDEIIVASEGQTIKGRFKIVRIGVNSAVVEDTQFKNHQQTLPLVEELQG
ncbi:MAG: hypothetical protein JO022_13635 [Acidobacteriaceae bacterium]|nr:hypothetical protein [Acidobacteriaceae bacterium]